MIFAPIYIKDMIFDASESLKNSYAPSGALAFRCFV